MADGDLRERRDMLVARDGEIDNYDGTFSFGVLFG